MGYKLKNIQVLPNVSRRQAQLLRPEAPIGIIFCQNNLLKEKDIIEALINLVAAF